MSVSLIPRTVMSLVQPSVQACASRLFVLSNGRAGSAKFHPTVNTFYETGLVTWLYEHLLMSPLLAHLEIRHEMPYQGPVGAPKRIDLWIRPPNGGYPHLIEAGDFSVGKIHKDVAKMKALNPSGANWFLAFLRDPSKTDPFDPWRVIQQSLGRSNGLDDNVVEIERQLTASFVIYRPNGIHDAFGAALIRAK